MSSTRIIYCVISCSRAIFNSVIQSVNTVIVLLFCLLPVIIFFTGILLCYSAIYRYYTIYRYSALLLFHALLGLGNIIVELVQRHLSDFVGDISEG